MILSLIRCPHCGTYRLVGDPCDCRTKLPPVIIGEGSLDDQIRYAIRCVCGQARVILEVVLISQHLRDPFPEDAKEFAVISESSMCECEPRCQWLDTVYWYADRSVVVKESQIATTLLGNVIRQLRGE